MPPGSDHTERRSEILEALMRVARSRGLHAVSMRTVAAETGVTVSTVQYYFHSKAELLLAGLQYLAEAAGRRASEDVRRAGTLSTRGTLRAWLVQMIPTGEEQRASHSVYAAYAALAFTDPALAEQPYTRNSIELQNALADLLTSAQHADEIPADREPRAEAANLLALATGLGDSVMANMRTAEDATDLLDYHLDRLFPGPRSRARTSRRT